MPFEKRFVYIRRNEDQPPRYYTGLAAEVPARLAAHNAGCSSHPAPLRPWRVDGEFAGLF